MCHCESTLPPVRTGVINVGYRHNNVQQLCLQQGLASALCLQPPTGAITGQDKASIRIMTSLMYCNSNSRYFIIITELLLYTLFLYRFHYSITKSNTTIRIYGSIGLVFI